jgi:hypothetical protein
VEEGPVVKAAAASFLILLAACTPHVSGLMPIEPAPDGGAAGSLRPVFRWEPMPGGDDPRITELVYDVQVLHASGGLVVQRDGLTGCEYELEVPLEPSHAYVWTVRARFRWEGRRRSTEWSRLTDPGERLAILVGPPPKYLPFRTPGEKK